jgi:hypothetical protein
LGPFPIATAALFLFFPVAFLVFKGRPSALATALVVMGGSMFLPEVAQLPDLPLIPTMDKEVVTYLASLLAIFTFHRKLLGGGVSGKGPEALFLLMICGFVGTVALNRQTVFNEGATREALGAYWLAAQAADDFLTLVVPFLVGRTMFRSVEDLKTLLYVIAGTGLIYTACIVIEVAMSIPFGVFQLSDVLYDLPMRPMSRWGFIQPLVFMDNGLSTASFMAVALLSGAALIAVGLKPTWLMIKRARATLMVGLLMTWNVAGITYGYGLTSAMSYLKPRGFAKLAMLLAVFTCVYPALRTMDLVPVERMVAFAERWINEERAFSLEGRFAEEDFVLGNIGNRLWVGWGMFDRIPGAESFGAGGETGLDSYYVIRTGVTGLFGMELVFLMLALPVITAWRRTKGLADSKVVILVAALMACVSLRMIDLLMNGLWNSLPFFLAGALYGVARSLPLPQARKTKGFAHRNTNLEQKIRSRAQRPTPSRQHY